jgi:hypothetical protein
MIFDGTVVLYLVGKENPVDSYLDIKAGDLDEVQSSAVSLTWPAGTTWENKAKSMLGAAGVAIGGLQMGDAGKDKSLRSTSFIGMLDRGMRTITNATGSDWFNDDGQAYVISWKGYRKGEKVVLSPKTGLVGIPKVTPQGIEAQCLLNPKLRLGSLVEIDSSLISDIPYIPGSENPWLGSGPGGFIPGSEKAVGPFFQYEVAGINPKGTYKILLLDHSGDTRGNTWYSFMVCAAAGDDGKELNQATAGTAFLRSRADFPPGG